MKRSVKIITAIALTAGIAIGTAAYAKHEFGSSERRASFMVKYVADELDLNATQEQALSALKDEVLAVRSKMHAQMAPTKNEIISLLAADSFDQGRALEIINSKATTLTQAAPTVIAAFGSFYDGLDAQQKAKIREFKEHHGEHQGTHRDRWADHH